MHVLTTTKIPGVYTTSLIRIRNNSEKGDKGIGKSRTLYFPVTLSEAPCSKYGEDGFNSCRETNAPDFIADEAMKSKPHCKW